MSARNEKGRRWFKLVLIVVAISAAVKAFFALGRPDMGEQLAKALVQFLGGAVLFGGVAYLLGWLTGRGDTAIKDEGTQRAGPEQMSNRDQS